MSLSRMCSLFMCMWTFELGRASEEEGAGCNADQQHGRSSPPLLSVQVDALAEEIMGRVLPEDPMPAEAGAAAEPVA